MSARYLGRGWGVVIRCNGDSCEARFQTANTVIKHNRKAAASAGWIRGGAKAHKRMDFCPACAPKERELVQCEAADRAQRLRDRDEARKAKFLPKPPKVKPLRKPRAKPEHDGAGA